MEEEEILNQIAKMLETNIKFELSKPRPSKTYAGRPKPVSGKYPTPISKPYASGNLYNSVKVFWDNINTPQMGLVVEFENAPYWEFINNGRKPNSGKVTGELKPALMQWARIKPLPQFRDSKGRFMSNEDRANLITFSVAKYGYYGTQFLDKAIDRTINKITDDLGEYYQLFFLNALTGGEEGPGLEIR
jgi:hypothetical protein